MDDNKIFKETEQVINITAESKATVRTNITVYSYDKNTAKFLFRLTKNSTALPMSNSAVISIALRFGTSGKAVLDAVVEDELEGLVSMVIPEEFLGYEGTVTGGVYINYSNGQSLDCGYFTFSMKRSMIDELTPEMPAYYVEGFENLRVEINEESQEMKTKLSELDTIFKDLDVYNKAQVDSKVNGLKPAIDEVTAQLAQTQKDFDTAVNGITVDSEIMISRNSTIKNKDFTTLDLRLEEIESDNKLKANKKQEDWITPTLLNGWTNFGGNFGGVGYRKNSLGKIELKGTVKGGSLTVSVYTLPSGYRPLTDRYYPVVASSSFGMVTVKSTGDVRVDIGSTAWVSLNNISFYTDE